MLTNSIKDHSRSVSLMAFALLILLTQHSVGQAESFSPKLTKLRELERDYVSKVETTKAAMAKHLVDIASISSGLESVSYFDSYSKFSERMFQLRSASPNGYVGRGQAREAYSIVEPELDGLKRTLRLVPDRWRVNKDWMEDHINRVYDTWQSSPFRSEISTESMIEGILPYRARDEGFEEWMPLARTDHRKLIEEAMGKETVRGAFEHIRKSISGLLQWYWNPLGDLNLPDDDRYSSMQKRLCGDCFDASVHQIKISRAAGLPASLYSIPAWGNHMRASHGWADLYTTEGVGISMENRIDNKNTETSSNSVVPGSFLRGLDEIEGMEPLANKVTFVRTVPKVYRKLSVGRKSDSANSRSHFDKFEFGPWEDVTKYYVKTVDLVIDDPLLKEGGKVYLNVFSTKGWDAVAVSEIADDGLVQFQDVGPNVLYLCTLYNEGYQQPIGFPFIAKQDSTIDYAIPSVEVIKAGTIKRKFPLFSKVARFANRLSLGSWEFSSELNGPVDSYPIEMLPADIKVFSLPQNDYRFLNLRQVEGARTAFIAELELFLSGETDGRLSSDAIRIHGGEAATRKMLDGSYSTYEKLLSESAIEFEVPEGSWISEVRYVTRSDTNFIEPGDEYELFYFDSAWKSLGKKTAEDFYLYYDNMPSGALFWLRNLTKGKEERPFTIKDGKQVFW